MELKEMKNVAVRIHTSEELNEYINLCEQNGWIGISKFTSRMAAYLPNLTIAVLKEVRFNLVSAGYRFFTLSELKKVQGIMKYKEGDVLVNEDGQEKKILAAFGSVYIPSNGSDFNRADSPYTEHELNDLGYTLKTDKPAKTDMTVSQLEVAAGLPAGTLNVVAEKQE